MNLWLRENTLDCKRQANALNRAAYSNAKKILSLPAQIKEQQEAPTSARPECVHEATLPCLRIDSICLQPRHG
jgi:hypothetical protein